MAHFTSLEENLACFLKRLITSILFSLPANKDKGGWDLTLDSEKLEFRNAIDIFQSKTVQNIPKLNKKKKRPEYFIRVFSSISNAAINHCTLLRSTGYLQRSTRDRQILLCNSTTLRNV